MNPQHNRIRALIKAMAPNRAAEYIAAFNLPLDETQCLIECDVRRRSYTEVGRTLHLSPETIKRARRRAFAHIADELNNRQEHPKQ